MSILLAGLTSVFYGVLGAVGLPDHPDPVPSRT